MIAPWSESTSRTRGWSINWRNYKVCSARRAGPRATSRRVTRRLPLRGRGDGVVMVSFPQAELIVNLRQHYKRWTGRAFRMRAACQKYDVPQCNRRRDIIDGGRNHYHFLAGDDLPGRAPVEYEATYRGVAETRRGARRMGVPVETGVVVKYV